MMMSYREFAFFRYASFAVLFVAIVSAGCDAAEKLSIDSMIRPGARISWSQRGFERPLLHQLLVVKTDGQTFKGFFRGSYRQFAGEAPPAFTHAEGYVGNGLIVFTVNGIWFDKGIERASIRKFSCHEGTEYKLKLNLESTSQLYGSPSIEFIPPGDLESEANRIERVLVACRENLVVANQVVKELSDIGEEIQLQSVGTFLDNANVAVKWTMKGTSYSKDRAEIVSMQMQKLLTIHEIYLSQEHSKSDFEMLSRMPHIGKIMIEGYRGEGLDLVPKDRTESLFLYQVKSIVPVDKLFPIIAKIHSLRELQLSYNNPAAPNPIASPNSTAVSFSSLSKLECLTLGGDLNPNLVSTIAECQRLKCFIFGGSIGPSSMKLLCRLPNLQQLSCCIDGTGCLSDLRSSSLSSVFIDKRSLSREFGLLDLEKSRLPNLRYLHLHEHIPGGDLEFYLRLHSNNVSDEELECLRYMEAIKAFDRINGTKAILRNLGQPMITGLNPAAGFVENTGLHNYPARLQRSSRALFVAGRISENQYKEFLAFTFPFTGKWNEESDKVLFTTEEIRWLNAKFIPPNR